MLDTIHKPLQDNLYAVLHVLLGKCLYAFSPDVMPLISFV